jgi:hypothetical protein
MIRRLARFAPLAVLVTLTGCGAAPDPLTDELPSMGDFRLGHNIVVADNMQQVPPSRDASAEEWTTILTAEIDRRFGLYEGDRLYHLGIAIDGYALAPPGIPLIMNPRSILVLSVNVWDDAAGVKLHGEPEQIVIFEGASTETAVIGSGIARSREEQMQVLARNAARQIQRWMLENPEWFNVDPDAPPFRAAPVAGQAVALPPVEPAPVDPTAPPRAPAETDAPVTAVTPVEALILPVTPSTPSFP